MKVKLKSFPDTQKLREIVASIPVPQEILKEALQSEGKITIDSTLEIQEKGASLVAQWLRICLLMQGTRVRALVWKDPTCCEATRPVSHNY